MPRFGPPPVINTSNEKHSFSASWKKLIKFCKPYLPAIILALLLAVGGTIFTILGPNKLSEMTEAIQIGLFGTIDLKLIGTIAFTLIAYYATSITFKVSS